MTPNHWTSLTLIQTWWKPSSTVAYEDHDAPIANFVACIETLLQRQVPNVGALLLPHLRPNPWMIRAPPTGTSFHQVLARRTRPESCLISLSQKTALKQSVSCSDQRK